MTYESDMTRVVASTRLVKRTRADFVTRRSIIEWPDSGNGMMRCRVLQVTDKPGGVILRVQPDRLFAEPLELELTTEDWLTVVGYSAGQTWS